MKTWNWAHLNWEIESSERLRELNDMNMIDWKTELQGQELRWLNNWAHLNWEIESTKRLRELNDMNMIDWKTELQGQELRWLNN
jgi:hypothetical protein